MIARVEVDDIVHDTTMSHHPFLKLDLLKERTITTVYFWNTMTCYTHDTSHVTHKPGENKKDGLFLSFFDHGCCYNKI